jgi:hypothetical protein
MITQFNKLSSAELELIFKAPILVSILIAGADGDIDRNEIKHSIMVAKGNRRNTKNLISDYYTDVTQDFEDKLKIILSSYPSNSHIRNQLISEELSELNIVFAKIDHSLALALYKSFKEIAEEVAQSSGGVLGFNSVGSEEAKLIELPMLHKP